MHAGAVPGTKFKVSLQNVAGVRLVEGDRNVAWRYFMDSVGERHASLVFHKSLIVDENVVARCVHDSGREVR